MSPIRTKDALDRADAKFRKQEQVTRERLRGLLSSDRRHANTRVKTWHDGKKAGFDANREVWNKERRFHQLNSRADDTEAYAIAVFELAAAAADEAAQAALQALLARNDANLAALPPGWADEELAVPA